MSPLERLIRAAIAERGPMPLSDWMALCLGHPRWGYYARRDPFGRDGDFVTAPEVSQLFGEMIGGWLARVWIELGRPGCVLAELGPGRGTLMADALRVAGRVPGFSDACALWLVETSPRLRRAQEAALAAHGPRWAGAVEDLPEGPLLLLANEFFDALPVRQFLRLAQGWQERVVTLSGGALAFAWGPARPHPGLDARFPGLAEGVVVEVSPAGEAVAAALGRRIARAGGAALVIDYGAWDGTGDTLQAVARHAPADPLAAPGEVDVTAHVRFRSLAEASGLPAWGPLPQGVWLERLGITERARRLAAGRAGAGVEAQVETVVEAQVEAVVEAQVEAVVAGHRRLTHPAEMGHLFKVMALTAPRAPAPPGWEAEPAARPAARPGDATEDRPEG